MLLGVLVALGVIILLATPGPWHKVVPATPRVQVGQPPPGDVIVFVRGATTGDACTGAVWIHLRFGRPSATAVVVPVQTTCLLPGAGMQPLQEIVRDAGAATAAEALGETLGVEFEGWVDVGRAALLEAFPPPGSAGVRERLYMKTLDQAWAARGGGARVLVRQTRFLRAAVAGWRRARFDIIGFANYVIGSPESTTDMKLQAVAAIGGVVKDTPKRGLVVGALPAVVYANGPYRRWCPDSCGLAAYRAAFALEVTQPSLAATVRERPVARRLLVMVEPQGVSRREFVACLRKRVHAYSAHRVVVETVVCRDVRDAQVTLRELARTQPPLAVVVAFGRRLSTPAGADLTRRLTTAALAEVRTARLPAVVAVLTDADPGSSPPAGGAAAPREEGGFPSVSPDQVMPTVDGRPASSASSALGQGAAECLVRAVQPRYFSPDLPATRSGVSYYARRGMDLTVAVGDRREAARLSLFLSAMGYRSVVSPWEGAQAKNVAIIRYTAGVKREALCVSGDMGLSRRNVIADTGLPAAVTVVAPSGPRD